MSSLCGVARHIVLLGDQCHQGVLVPYGGALVLQGRFGRLFVSRGIHANASRMRQCSAAVRGFNYVTVLNTPY